MTTAIRKPYFLTGVLIIQTIGLLIYSIIVFQNDGFNFFAKAQEFLFSMKWMGQFALDFSCYLMLSALWISWRNKYSLNSIVIALIAMIFGIIFFAPYLLYLLRKEKGDVKKVLLGNRI